jgi:transcription termination factor 2
MPAGANHCFVMDLPYNPSILDQACDRIYRVGQLRPVTVHHFLTSSPVDRWQRYLLHAKRKLAQTVSHNNVRVTSLELGRLFATQN